MTIRVRYAPDEDRVKVKKDRAPPGDMFSVIRTHWTAAETDAIVAMPRDRGSHACSTFPRQAGHYTGRGEAGPTVTDPRVTPGRKPFPRMRLLKVAGNAPEQHVSTPLTDAPPIPKQSATVWLLVNGIERSVEVPINETLAETLRWRLGLTGTKLGCDDGSCGTCTVLLDADPVYACMVLTVDCAQKSIETIEGLGTEQQPHPLQLAFAETYAAQCGFCTPGAIIAAKALLDRIPRPSEPEVRLALSGVLCRCGYRNIIAATLQAAEALAREPRR